MERNSVHRNVGHRVLLRLDFDPIRVVRSDFMQGHEVDHHEHHEHHAHAGHETGSVNAMAASATLHCLTGCAIGEVLGMVLATWWGWGDLASIALAVALAFFFGYLLTFVGVRRAGLSVGAAVRTALAADTISILVMEVVDNAILLTVPGAMEAHLDSLLFWGALAVALAVAFVVTVPVNKAMIDRGRGHAVVHEMHHADH